MTSPQPKELDVHELPSWAPGSRDPMWWGVALLICIESTMFGLMVATYLDVRGNFPEWPPTGPSRQALVPALIGMAALVASVPVMVRCSRAGARGEMRRARAALIACTVLGLVFLVCRALELERLAFRWDDHAYGSVFWVTLGIHTIHGVASIVENLMFIALLFTNKVEEKHRTDLQCNALYWYFVVFAFLPIGALFYIDGMR
jgi:cytochrome c oxidase subunit 3